MRAIEFRSSWPHRFLVVFAAWVITCAVGLMIAREVSGSRSASATRARPAGTVPGLGWNGNLYPLGPPGTGAAEKMTVTGAEAAVGFPVSIPSNRAASRSNLAHVWVSTSGRHVALVFGNGLVDITMARAQYNDALRQFRTFIAENRVAAAIGRVNGRPALVIQPNTDAVNHSNPAYVEFERNGVDVHIWSHAYGTNVLLRIAKSMR
jgi:hypothetical protein